MANNGGAGARPNWNLAVDQITGQGGTVRLKMLGAVNGTPRAELEVWAASSADLVEFLKGCAEVMAQRHSKIVAPGDFRP